MPVVNSLSLSLYICSGQEIYIYIIIYIHICRYVFIFVYMHNLQVLVDFSFDRGKLGQASWEVFKKQLSPTGNQQDLQYCFCFPERNPEDDSQELIQRTIPKLSLSVATFRPPFFLTHYTYEWSDSLNFSVVPPPSLKIPQSW